MEDALKRAVVNAVLQHFEQGVALWDSSSPESPTPHIAYELVSRQGQAALIRVRTERDLPRYSKSALRRDYESD